MSREGKQATDRAKSIAAKMSVTTGHSKLLAYMLGWHKGAGRGAFTDEQMLDEDFKEGHSDGRYASVVAYDKASKKYQSKLFTIQARECTHSPRR